MASLEVPGVAPRPDSCRVAGRRELDLDWSGIVQEMNDIDGGCRGVREDLAEPPVMVEGLVPEVDADGEDGAAETIGPILVRDKAESWREKTGALISREFSLTSTDALATVQPICQLELKWCACPATKNVLPEALQVHLSLPMRAEVGLSSGFRSERRRRRPDHVPTSSWWVSRLPGGR